ncbi:MAG: thiol-disulfide oxidoreductase DCC family protein [Dehalococcoidia bacterium]
MEPSVVSLGSPGALPDRATLLYDDGCRFCRAMAELLFHLARGSELSFLPWSSPLAQEWIRDLTPEVRDASMHLKLPDGTLQSGAGVLALTLAHVRGLKWIAWLSARIPLLRRYIAWQYAFVAGRREFFSKIVPNRAPVRRDPAVR